MSQLPMISLTATMYVVTETRTHDILWLYKSYRKATKKGGQRERKWGGGSYVENNEDTHRTKEKRERENEQTQGIKKENKDKRHKTKRQKKRIQTQKKKKTKNREETKEERAVLARQSHGGKRERIKTKKTRRTKGRLRRLPCYQFLASPDQTERASPSSSSPSISFISYCTR